GGTVNISHQGNRGIVRHENLAVEGGAVRASQGGHGLPIAKARTAVGMRAIDNLPEDQLRSRIGLRPGFFNFRKLLLLLAGESVPWKIGPHQTLEEKPQAQA